MGQRTPRALDDLELVFVPAWSVFGGSFPTSDIDALGFVSAMHRQAMAENVIHISEAEGASDFAFLMARARPVRK